MHTHTFVGSKGRPGRPLPGSHGASWLLAMLLLLSSFAAQAQLTGTTYTINPTGAAPGTAPYANGTNFQTFTQAISALNATTTLPTGGVTFNVTKTTYTEATGTPAITKSGTAGNRIIFQESPLTPTNLADNPVVTRTTATTGFTDNVFVISGASYLTFDGISVAGPAVTNVVEFGYLVRNTAATTGGATNNIIRNARITLDRTSTNTVGLLQSSSASTTTGALGGGGVSVTAAGGANQSNTYSNLTIENAYRGIHLLSASTTVYDSNTTVSGCTIGADISTVPGGDIGNSTSTVTAGIQSVRQTDVNIFDNTVRNLTMSGGVGYGISLELSYGACNVYRNRIYDIRNVGTSSTSTIYGLRLDVTTIANAGNIITAHNNFIYNITHAYATASATRYAIGLATQLTSGTATSNTSSIRVFYNSVRMELPAAFKGSSTAFASLQTTLGPVLTVRNNVFTNYSPTPTGTGTHYAISSSSATAFGYTGSTSDYNDLYVTGTATTGLTNAIGLGSATDYVTLADWQNAYPGYGNGGGTTKIDASSKSVDPAFTSATDLHVSSPDLNNTGMPVTSSAPGIGVDIDLQTRNASTPDIGADEFTPSADDVAVLAITAPTSPVGIGAQTVTVSIQNNGLMTLNSVTLAYALNGGTAVTQNFTGIGLAAAGTTTLSFTTQATLVSGANTLVVTGSLPNGSADPTAGNNTASTTVYTALNGTYTINKLAAASPTNFVSFTAAATALNQGGVAGAVILNVLNGPYNEQFALGVVAGSSATRTITVDGGASKQTLTYTATAAQPAAVLLNGTQYVTLNNLTVDNSTTATYGICVLLVGQANFTTVSNCVLKASLTNTGTINAGVAISGGVTSAVSAGQATDLRVLNNTISGGYDAVICTGAAANILSGIQVKNNIVTDSYLYSIDLEYTDGAEVSGNDISRTSARATFSTFAGTYFTGTTRNALVTRNRIHDPTTTATPAGTCYGIFFTAADATPGNYNQVTNNLIYNYNGSGIQYGLYTSGSDYSLFYHNTVSLDNTASTSASVTYGAYQTTAADGVEFKNNIISVTRGGTANRIALVFAAAASTVFSDYNDLNIGTGSNFFTGAYPNTTTTFATLADWKTAGGPGAPAAGIYDQNSVQVDPAFVGTTLVPSAAQLNASGDNALTTAVTTDFAGAARPTAPATRPDIGAYEFVPPANNVALTAFVAPVAPVSAGSSPVTVTVLNNGDVPLTSLTLSYTFNGGSAVTQTITGLNIASGTSGPVSFSAANNVMVATGSNTLTVVATLPNGTTDSNPSDNTVATTFRTALAGGTYTINSGAATTGLTNVGPNQNFQTFADAALALNEGGILGAVVFNVVAGSGPYNELVSLNVVAGASSTNTITINGNGRTLTSGATTASVANLGVLTLNGTDYLTLNNLVVNATATATAAGIRLTNQADNNTINGCTVTMDASATASTLAGIAASSSTTVIAVGNAANNLTLNNNTVTGGYYGIIINGVSATSRSTGLVMTNNTVRDFYAYGIDVESQENPQIIGNDVGRPTRTAVTSFYGIYMTGCQSADVERNRIHDSFTGNTASTSLAYGIYFTTNDAVSGSENDVVNNLVYKFNGSGIEYGIYNIGSDYARYYYNTVSLDNTAANTASLTKGFFQTTAATGVEFVDNVVSVTRNPTGTGAKNAVDYATTTSSIYSNYNDLYIGSGTAFFTGSYGTTDYTTLANWQTANTNSYDQNSVQVAPDFTAPAAGNLQPAAATLNNTGTPLARVPQDFTGATRNATTPDPGAYEFAPAATDIAPVALAAPLDGQTCYGAAQAVTVTVRNRGTNTLNFASTPATVTVNVTGPVTATLMGSITSGTLASGTSQNVTLAPTVNLSAAGTYTFAVTASVPGDGNPANNTLTPSPTVTVTAPAAGTLSPGTASTCYSQGQLLTLTGSANGSIQFQQSTTSGTTGFTDIAGATSATYTTVPTTVTTYYRALTTCGSNVATSNVATITIDNPQPVSATAAGSVCEGNTTTITVTRDASQSEPRLFTAATGGTSLTPTSNAGNAYTFTTSTLAAGTTSYYAAAVVNSTQNVGKLAYNPSGQTPQASAGLYFTTTKPVTIQTVTVYLNAGQAAGTVLIALRSGSSNTGPIVNSQGLAFAIPAGPATGIAPYVVPLNYVVPAAGSYTLTASAPTQGGFLRDALNDPTIMYPYNSPDGSVSITGPVTAGYYYYFYNWVISGDCEGSRVAVPVTATAAPAFSFSPASPQTICSGSSVSTSATYSTADYDTFVYTASPSGASAGISQASTSSPTATLTPTVTTTYTLTGSKAGAGAGACQAIRTLTVNVNPLPVVVATASPTASNAGDPVVLTTTGLTTTYASQSIAYAPYTATGTVTTYNASSPRTLGTADDGFFTTTLPFDFSYFGTSYANGSASLHINTNGYVVLGAAPTSSPFTPANIPTAAVPNNMIAGNLHDLDLVTGTITTFTNGSSPNRVFVVSYNGIVDHLQVQTSTFQIVLHEGSNVVDIISTSVPVPLSSTGHHVQGIENATGTVGYGSTATTASATATWSLTNAAYAFLPVGGSVGLSYNWMPGNLNGQTVTVYPTTTTTYTVTATNTSTGCPSAPSSVTVNVTPDLVVSTGTAGSPTAIPAGTYHHVTVTGAGYAALTGALTLTGNLTVQNGGGLNTACQVVNGTGTFTVAAGGTLGICDPAGIAATSSTGPIQMTGIRTYSDDANYIYNGTAAQTTGDGLPATVRNITVNNAAGVTLTNPLAVRQVLSLPTAGNLTTGGQMLTLRSQIGYGTALVDNTGGTVIGTATMQRAVDIRTDDNIGYHHYSSPMVSTPIDDLQTPGFNFVLNPAFNTATLTGQTRPYPTVLGYDQARLATSPATDLGAFDKGFFSPTTGDLMGVGRGYTANVPNALNVDFVGAFNNGPVAAGGTLTRDANTTGQEGWQLLGNPYPSPLNWATVTAAQRVNLDAAAYVYHATSRYTGFYTTYLTNGLVTNGVANTSGGAQTDPIIDAGAGFFARVTAPGTGALNLSNANRVTTWGNQANFGRANGTRPQLTLRVNTAAGATDGLVVYFDPAATSGVDAEQDATKLTNSTGLNLAALAGNTKLAIDGRPAPTVTTVVPLSLGVPAAGTYALNVTQLANFGSTQVYLRDAVAGTEQLLAAGTTVPVTLTNVATATTRFSLVFRPSGALATAAALTAGQVSLYPNPAHSQFTLLLPPVAGAKAVQATLLNALGQTVLTRTIGLTAGGAEETFNTTGLAQGVYMLRLQAGNETLTQKVVVE